MNPNLEISTVVGCKMNCSYCPQKVHAKNYSAKSREFKMDYQQFVYMLLTVPKHVNIHFAGMAEPWLNDMCTDMVVHAHNKGHKIGVYTTLEGMTIDDIMILKDIPFMFFCLHLPDAQGDMKLKVDDQYISNLKAILKVIDCQKMVIGKLHPEVEKITGPVADGSPGLYSRGGSLWPTEFKKGNLECSACGPKIDHNILLPNGDVLLCCMDYAQKHVIGNLLKIDYEDLFKGEGYQRVMKGLKDESIDILCRHCEVSKQI